VDGFRVDVMWHMIKDDKYRDNPTNPDYKEHQATYEKLMPAYSTDQPEVHDIVHMMRKVLDSYDERMMIGEIYLPIHKLMTYYGTDKNGAHLPFNFLLLSIDWDASKIASNINQYEGALPDGGWPNWVLGNHDQPRITSRVGKAQARVAAMLLLTLRGTPTVYYGDEIGMRDVPIPEDEIQDPQGLNMPGLNLSRDPQRTPMQWDNSENAGFSKEKPWLRLPEDFTRINVKVQQEKEHGILALHKKLIQLRQQEPALHIGEYRPVVAKGPVMAYMRYTDEQRFLIVLNLSHKTCYFSAEHFSFEGTIEINTIPEREGQEVSNTICLSGDEGMVIRLKNK
jgi:alpha-glucosidase